MTKYYPTEQVQNKTDNVLTPLKWQHINPYNTFTLSTLLTKIVDFWRAMRV
jgi:hypothetical protein